MPKALTLVTLLVLIAACSPSTAPTNDGSAIIDQSTSDARVNSVDAADHTTTSDVAMPSLDAAGHETSVPSPDVIPRDAPIHSCDNLGAVGEFQNITPPTVNLDPAFPTPSGANYGMHAFVIHPNDSATLIAGTSSQGIFKTTDCGGTWIHINTGMNGDTLDHGRQGSMAIDPVDPNIMYTDDRYGVGGLYKTTNGGVDWTQIFPPDILPVFINGGTVESVAIDPTDHLHIVSTPHFSCVNTQGQYDCMLESEDGGTTWRIIPGTPGSTELGGIVMLDRTTWLWAGTGGLSRTSDGGATWTNVSTAYVSPYVYQASDGSYYIGASQGNVLRSRDTIQWTPVDGSPPTISLASDGTNMFVGIANFITPNLQYYYRNALSSSAPYAMMNNPPMAEGPWMMRYDPAHHLLYSSNFLGGFWRVRTE